MISPRQLLASGQVLARAHNSVVAPPQLAPKAVARGWLLRVHCPGAPLRAAPRSVRRSLSRLHHVQIEHLLGHAMAAREPCSGRDQRLHRGQNRRDAFVLPHTCRRPLGGAENRRWPGPGLVGGLTGASSGCARREFPLCGPGPGRPGGLGGAHLGLCSRPLLCCAACDLGGWASCVGPPQAAQGRGWVAAMRGRQEEAAWGLRTWVRERGR